MRELTDLEREMLQSARWLDLSHHRGELLKELHARAQRLEATLVLTEDQRDKALKKRDALREQLNDLQAGMRQWEDEHASAVASVIAERDELRKQLDEIKSVLDQQAISREARKPLRDYQRRIINDAYAKSKEGT